MKTFDAPKKLPNCRRTTISTLEDIRGAKIPRVDDVGVIDGRKAKVTKVYSKSNVGPIVQYQMVNGDVGTLMGHYWWDKLRENNENKKNSGFL